MSAPDAAPADAHQILVALQCANACCARSRKRCHCPVHDAARGGTPDLDVELKGGVVLFTCRVGCDNADVLSALQDRGLWGRRNGPAEVVPLRREPPRAARGPKVVATTRHEIRDTGGALVAIHPRVDHDDGSKSFTWWLPNADKPGLKGRRPETLPLYGAELLPDLAPGALVLLCEGESATEAARSLGFAAVGTVCGASLTPDDAALDPLVRLTAVLWADHDDPGTKHMRGIADRLHALGGTCYLFDPGTEPKDDARDFLERGGTHEQLEAMIRALTEPYDPRRERLAGLKLWSAGELSATTFPTPKTIVPTLLPEGVMLLVGRPKLGKSRLALNLGVAVAAGGRALGTIAVEPGRVLYLALEDGERRTQARMRALCGERAPSFLSFSFGWPHLDSGGLDAFDAWCELSPTARLIVVDTAERIRPSSTGRQQLYREDYAFLAPLNDLALRRGVCILVVHHTRKGESDDPLDTVSGSTGLTGAVDGALILKRERGRSDATLHVIHRDLDDAEYALKMDPAIGSWALIGDAAEYRLSQERADILGAVREAGQPVGPKQVADMLGKQHRAVIALMNKMARDGLLMLASYGKYTLPYTPTSPYVERD